MSALPLIRITNLQPIVRVLQAAGAPTERMVQAMRLPALALDDADVFVPTHLGWSFGARAARQQGIEDLGLRSGALLEIEEMDWTRQALASEATVGGALRRFARNAKTESPRMHLWLQPFGDNVGLGTEGSLPFEEEGGEFDEQFMLSLLMRFLSCACGVGWRPRAIHARTTDLRTLERSRLLRGIPIRGGSAFTAILFDRATLHLPIATGREERRGRSTKASPPPAMDFVPSFRRVLEPFLASGIPSLGAAAEIAGTSVRTLQRRLRSAGVSYFEICDELRREVALRLVRGRSVRLLDVALDLGYSDAAHFTRAFRRWTGVNPQRYRDQLAEES